MRRIRPQRSPAAPLLLLAWAGAAAVLWLWWHNTPAVAASTADRLVNAGRITGLLAGYAIALVIAQMARVPALERRVGSDRVVRRHARSGRYALTAGAVRRRMRYEVWYYLHLLTYAAVCLAFWHQLATGSEFVGNAVARSAWYALYVTVGALLLWYRVLTVERGRVQDHRGERRPVSRRDGAQQGHQFHRRPQTQSGDAAGAECRHRHGVGATYTSAGYKQSLQSALDRADG